MIDFIGELVAAGAPETPEFEGLAANYLASRDKATRDALVMQFSLVAAKIASRFRFWRTADDVMGAAMLQLVESIDAWDGVEPLDQYVVKKVYSRARNTATDRKESAGASSEETEETRPEVPEFTFTMLDALSACRSKMDERIITLRAENRAVKEVARLVDRSQSFVYSRLKTILSNYLAVEFRNRKEDMAHAGVAQAP